MSARVLLIDPDDASRTSLAAALGRAGFGVLPLPDPITALDVLDAAPGDLRLAVVSVRQLPGKPHGIAFALMMHARDNAARIVLLVDRPQDIKLVEEADKHVFAGILVTGADASAIATEIVQLFG